MSMSGPFSGLGGIARPAQSFAAQQPPGGIDAYRGAFAQFFGMRPGRQPNLGAYRPEAFGLPFLAAAYAPFAQSFQNTGLVPVGQDPFGDQVRQLTPSQQQNMQKADRFQQRAVDAEARGGDGSYVRLPNGSVIDRPTFERLYKDKRHDSWKSGVEYLGGSDAAKRYRELALQYGNT